MAYAGHQSVHLSMSESVQLSGSFRSSSSIGQVDWQNSVIVLTRYIGESGEWDGTYSTSASFIVAMDDALFGCIPSFHSVLVWRRHHQVDQQQMGEQE